MFEYSMLLKNRDIAEKNIRRIYLAIFLFTTFAGILRKWIFDSSIVNNILLLSQLLMPFVFLFVLGNRKINSPFSPFLIWYVIFLFIMGFNPMNLTIFHSVLGIITHLGFWFAFYFYINNTALFKIEKLLPFFVIVGVGQILLGAVQYSLPVNHFLNRYANADIIKNIAEINGAVRVTGTFSYLGGYNSFLLFYSLMVWALLRIRVNKTFPIVLYMIGLVGCFMSGSRTSMYIYLATGILLIYHEFGIKRLSNLLLIIIITTAIAFGSLYFLGNRLNVVSGTVERSYKNFEGRRINNKNSGEEEHRIIGSLYDVIFFPGDYPLFGVGLGSTYQGATALWGVSPYILAYPSWLEEEPERIVVEGGFFLLVLKIFLFATLFKNLKIPSLTKLILLLLIFLFVPIVYNTYNSIYLFLGLVLLDSTYRRQIDKKLQQPKRQFEPSYNT